MLRYQELKQRVTIEEVLAHYKVRTTKKGSQHVAECPFCTGTFKASFREKLLYMFLVRSQREHPRLRGEERNMSIRDSAYFLFATFLDKPEPRPMLARLKAIFAGSPEENPI